MQPQLTPRHNQLYTTLLREYEDTRLQLAEARLHIDRMRFGRNVDLHRQYVIRHLHNQDHNDGGDISVSYNSNGGSFVHSAATISALSMSTPALPSTIVGGGNGVISDIESHGGPGLWCSDPQISAAAGLLDKETQYSLSSTSTLKPTKVDIADALSLLSQAEGETQLPMKRGTADADHHKAETATANNSMVTPNGGSIPSDCNIDCSLPKQDYETTSTSTMYHQNTVSHGGEISSTGCNTLPGPSNKTGNRPTYTLTSNANMGRHFSSCSSDIQHTDSTPQNCQTMFTSQQSADDIPADLPMTQYSVKSDDIRAWLNEKWSGGSATGTSAAPSTSILDIENSSKVLHSLRQQVKALTEHVLNNDESIEYLYNEILNIQYDHHRLVRRLNEILKDKEDVKLALQDQVISNELMINIM